jgi:site-specific recombinase XerD
MNVQKMPFEAVYQAFEEHMLLKNFALATRKTYLSNFKRYYQWTLESEVDKPYDQDVVRRYLLYRVRKGAKWQTMNSIYSAMRKLFREVLDLDWSLRKLPRPNKERHLPELISRQEVMLLIKTCRHLKHQAMIVTLYATGLRAGELSRLKLDHIDARRLQIRVVKGKGAKDRYVNVPEQLIVYLRQYYKAYRPVTYLFNGKRKGEPLSLSAMRWPLRQAKSELGWTKKISPHTLRHCYATHHLETGTDLVFLKQNMGHKHFHPVR